MTPAQIAEAQRMAREWSRENERVAVSRGSAWLSFEGKTGYREGTGMPRGVGLSPWRLEGKNLAQRALRSGEPSEPAPTR